MNVVQLFRGSSIQPYYLRLVAPNGQVLAVSEGYVTRWGAKRAAKRNFSGLTLIDLTGRRGGGL